MSKVENFIKFFKLPVLLASFGGVYVPESEKLLPFSCIYKKIFKFFSAISFFTLITTYIDKTYVALYDEKYVKLKYFLIGGMVMIPACVLRNLYMIVNQKEWSGIIEQWNTSFQKCLLPNIRKVELERERKMVETFIKWEYSLMVFPVLIWAFSPMITGKQGINSYLPWDHEHSPTFEITAVYHFIYGYFITATWSANDSFLMIYMSLLTAELRYLKISLKSILQQVKVREAGVVYIGDNAIKDFHSKDYDKKMMDIKLQLEKWISHHGQLAKFSDRLENFYKPMVLLEYSFFVTFSCLLIFYAASGMLSPILTLVALSLPSSHGIALYLMSWFGERIAIQNHLISEEIFHNDWFLLPKRIQKNLQFIMMRVQRPMRLTAFSMMPLNIKTFVQILKACYTFYMFIRDSNRKALRRYN